VSEAGFTGLACGAALVGLKPICEFMSFNCGLQAIDHMVNSAAKIRYMSGGRLHGSIVFRGINGQTDCTSAQLSQCFASWYSSVPGLLVLSPYDAEDARGLLKSAIRDDNPVVFLENLQLYDQAFEVRPEVLEKDFVLPIGKAKVMRPGTEVSVFAHSRMVGVALAAARELEKIGLSAEVVNLRTLKPIDLEAIVRSVRKTKRIVTVEEGWAYGGIGAEVCARIMESETFDYLDAPVERLTSADVPAPYSKVLDDLHTPRPVNVVNACLRVCKTK
jgi:pyruvate dehydrogenase E1 component beta subunit